MATKGTPQNGHIRLEEALTTLFQNQAAFVGHIAENDRRHRENDREMSERVARIETKMTEVIRVLTEHGRQLERLTEAVRDKIGFKG